MNDLGKILKDKIVIDSHLHMGFLSSLNIPCASDNNIISLLKKYGVNKAIVSHHADLSTPYYGKELLFRSLEKFPDFLYGLLVFNPNFSNSSLESIKKNYQRKQIAGIKIHPFWHMCYPGDHKYEKFWDFVCENGIPVLTHTWNPNVANKGEKFADPFLFEDILNKWNGLKLIFAHAGGRGEYLYKVIDLMEKYPDLYVDFAGDIFEPGLLETYVGRVGSDRIFFGSDMPWIDVRYYLVNILSADIEDQDKENILGINASRFFSIR